MRTTEAAQGAETGGGLGLNGREGRTGEERRRGGSGEEREWWGSRGEGRGGVGERRRWRGVGVGVVVREGKEGGGACRSWSLRSARKVGTPRIRGEGHFL